MAIDLRMILLGIGAVIILAIILDSLRRRKKIQQQVQEFEETVLTNVKADHEKSQSFFIPEGDDLFESFSEPKAITPKPNTMEKPVTKAAAQGSAAPQRASTSSTNQAPLGDIIALTILPHQSNAFSGRSLNAALQANQMKFGSQRIFHKHRGDHVDAEILFSLASLTEPGYFEPNKIATSQFKGIILFMQAELVHDPLQTFEKMLAVARNISHSIQGKICDESRNPLSAQVTEHIKENIRETQRRLLAKEKSVDS